MNQENVLQVGVRVQIDKQKAHVRFVGEVVGQDGTWVGLEWDDISRGKHDGSTGGKQYFECVFSSAGGSFVRAPKFLQVADFGMPFLEALKLRYTEKVEGAPDAEMYVHTASNRKLNVILVGAEKAQRRIGQLDAMVEASLVNARVSGSVSHL